MGRGAATRPIFSVLIPSYNRPDHIARCIESVFANEEEEIEIVVSDDASPQREAIINAIRPYIAQSKVHFYQQSINIGEPANRNFLVSRSTGHYNIILSDDDTLLPHALGTMRRYIQRVPDHDLYMFGYRVMDGSGRKCYDRAAPKPMSIGLEQPSLIQPMFEATWLPFLVCHPATFCCRRGIEQQIPYRQDVLTADDYMFLLECLNKGKRIYVIPECLMTYQWTQSAAVGVQGNQSADNLTVMKAYTKIYYSLQERTDLHPSVSAFIKSENYRKQFLYNLVIHRNMASAEVVALLGLQPSHLQELKAHSTSFRKYTVCLISPMYLIMQLTRHFGAKGLLYSIQVALAYLKYKILRPCESQLCKP